MRPCIFAAACCRHCCSLLHVLCANALTFSWLNFPVLSLSQNADEVKEEKVVEPVVPLDPQSALKAVLRTSLFHDGLARGLHEAVKGARGFAMFCSLVRSVYSFFWAQLWIAARPTCACCPVAAMSLRTPSSLLLCAR